MPGPYKLYTLGDAALTIEVGTDFSVGQLQEIIHLKSQLLNAQLVGIKEIISAYNSLTLYIDTYQIHKQPNFQGSPIEWIQLQIRSILDHPRSNKDVQGSLHQIPVCYHESLGTDLQRLAEKKKLPIPKLIDLHSAAVYNIYMIGFTPGFAYMGTVSGDLFTKRKDRPENIEAGSVAVAGWQTGIYPFKSPGGWHVLGRTPITIFDPTKTYPVFWKPGDQVKFVPISLEEYHHLNSLKHVDTHH